MWQKLSLIILGTAATIYITICLLLRFGQTKMIFLPDNEIKSTPQEYGLAYQDVWLELEEDQVHGWWIPATHSNAPALLYFHGNASNNGDLGEVAAIFHQLGVSVLLIDYRGYGKSSPVFPNERRVYEDAEAAWQYLIQEQQIKPQHIVVYGHSLGGAIAIDLATKHPEMAGIITEGTFTSIEKTAGLMPGIKLFPLSLLVTQRFNSITKIESLKTPILILHGTADEVIPSFMSEQLFAAAPEPKRLEIFPQAGHNNLPEFDQPKFLSILQQFIDLAIKE
ncbi:MAG: alpha/beta fold hydrolase [Cyanobacteria bacterium P01_C01_bin.72]